MSGAPYKKRQAVDSGMTKSYTLDSYILPGTLSFRSGNAINVQVQLDTGNEGRTLLRHDKAMLLVSQNLVRPHEVTYTMPNGTVMNSSGSIELNVAINFDDINKDVEILNNLRFDLVEQLHNPDVDCIIMYRVQIKHNIKYW